MAKLPDLQIQINGHHTFFLNQKIVSTYCGTLKKLIKQEKKRKTQIANIPILIELDGFPGGPGGFELITSFCYNNDNIQISISNICSLHCGSIYLDMNHKASVRCNLLQRTEAFLEGMFEWSWKQTVFCLKSCESFFEYADSHGLVEKLLFSLLAKIAQNTDINLTGCSSTSSSSSPENASGDQKNNGNGCSGYFSTNATVVGTGTNRAWWFDDLTNLSPRIIEKMIKSLGAYGSDNNSLILTKFILHYLKTASANPLSQNRGVGFKHSSYSGLADTAVHGVILMGKTAFSCRSLFWVMRTVATNFGVSQTSITGLENLIGSILDEAKLDDLLVCGGGGSSGGGGSHMTSGAHQGDGPDGVYDVDLVMRLMRVFVESEEVSVKRMRKVGWLIDQYLCEISPDLNLKVSKFMAVAQCLPDVARHNFDGVYRAIDIYLESHPGLSSEEKSRLCRCLNFSKLSLETCKDLAKNRRIPPRITVEALAAQTSAKDYNYESSCESLTTTTTAATVATSTTISISNFSNRNYVASKSRNHNQVMAYNGANEVEIIEEENEDMRMNIERMKGRVLELEKACKEMKGQMSKLATRQRPLPGRRPSPRLC